MQRCHACAVLRGESSKDKPNYMIEIKIEIPDDKISKEELIRSLKTFLENKYATTQWKIHVSMKHAPSLKFRDRKSVGDWRVLD